MIKKDNHVHIEQPIFFPCNSFKSACQKKPIEDVRKIIDICSAYGEEIHLPKGDILRYKPNGKHHCYLLTSGSFSLNRRGDGMILNSEKAPFIMGVSNQFVCRDRLYIRILEDSTVVRMPLERFNLLMMKFALWESLCSLLIYTASRVFEHCTMIEHMPTYDIVKFQLNQLMLESPALRTSMTAANYIMARTYLSRSSVMRIISDLRNAGFITMEKGVLLDLKPLPLKY